MKVSKSQVIFKTALVDDKIYVKTQSGFFSSLRLNINTFLLVLFIGLPLLTFEGRQAFLFDVSKQQFHILHITLFPQDFMAFVFIFIIAAFLLFYISTKFGRIWWGFTCPQTVWTAAFMWVENKIEGNRQQRINLDKQKLVGAKLVKKLIKHSIWLCMSFLTATVFVSYFVSANELYTSIFTGSTSSTVVGWIFLFSICTYFNAGLIREKMCQHMCPYSRFQSVMVEPSTKVVIYNKPRGESRGPRKIQGIKSAGLGDCVDCALCVQVCPVGIDIREGFQADCINCGLCIDACDQTMAKFGYPKRLIDFTAAVSETNFLKTVSYLGLVIGLGLVSLYWINTRSEMEMTVMKDRNLLYRDLGNGRIENLYLIELINKTNQHRNVRINLSTKDLVVNSEINFQLKPLETSTYPIQIETRQDSEQSTSRFSISLINLNGEVILSREATFIRPTFGLTE